MGSVNSPLQSLDSLETHRFDEGVVRQALISEHSVPECDFVKLRGDEMQPDPATRPRQPSLDERRVMVAGIVQEDVELPLIRKHRLDRHQQHDRACGVRRQHVLHDGLAGLEVDRAVDVQSVPAAALLHRDGAVFWRPAANRPHRPGRMHRVREDEPLRGWCGAGPQRSRLSVCPVARLSAGSSRPHGRSSSGLRCRLPPLGKPVLVAGHLDTVWSYGTLDSMPYAVNGAKAHGPGIYDMKAGSFLAFHAVRSILRQGVKTKRPIVLLLTPDEEVGSPTSRDIIERE